MIHKEAGIHLSGAKKALLVGRLAPRLRELGVRSFHQYYQHVTEPDRRELVKMLDCISTNETRFFREPQHFDLIADSVVPEWTRRAARGLRDRRVRAWSAACSSGEEPYSLAMCLLHHFPPQSGWHVEILATDISTRALEKAKRATWPVERAKEIPNDYLKRFMLRGTRGQEGRMKPGPELRAVVRFGRLNLNDAAYPLNGAYDLVFCRNVLIYFEPEGRRVVIDRLLSYLSPDGLLFVGHAETLAGAGSSARIVSPSVYAIGSEE